MPILNVYCLPCAGASATMYLRWRRLLPSWINIIPVELAGRGTRLSEPAAEQFDQVLIQLIESAAGGFKSPYVLFGHSMGALLAYGLAQQLVQRQLELPLAVFASGCAAPSRRDGRLLGNKDKHALIADLRRQGGTPEEVFNEPELLEMTLDLLSTDYRVCDSFIYNPLPLLNMPIHVFSGYADAIKPEQLAAWQGETTASGSLDWFEGGHFFLRHDEHAFLHILTERLSKYRYGGIRAQACSS